MVENGGELTTEVDTNGETLGSINKLLGKIVGIIVAPFVRAFLIKKHAMLNSFLSNLPSLSKSAKFHI